MSCIWLHTKSVLVLTFIHRSEFTNSISIQRVVFNQWNSVRNFIPICGKAACAVRSYPVPISIATFVLGNMAWWHWRVEAVDIHCMKWCGCNQVAQSFHDSIYLWQQIHIIGTVMRSMDSHTLPRIISDKCIYSRLSVDYVSHEGLWADLLRMS